MVTKATINRLEAELKTEGGKAESRKEANRNLEDILEELLAISDASGLDFDESLGNAQRYYAARKERERRASPLHAESAGSSATLGGNEPALAGLPDFGA